VNPRKLKDVDAILEERGQDLPSLFAELEAKYGVRFGDVERKRTEAKRLLTEFYEQHNPRKLGEVDRILNDRSPDYDKLFKELEARYQMKLIPTG
jgi:hypothetical protein